MFEEISRDLFRIEVPIPQSPLKALNSYLIKGKSRCLLIDTGLNRDECRDILFSSLEKLHVDFTKLDIYITHLHSDHVGLAGEHAFDTSKVYLHHRDYQMLEFEKRWDQFRAFFISNGFPESEVSKAFEGHQGRQYSLKRHIDFTPVSEGDRIETDNYALTCIETPGHSPGHTCLYEPDKKILFTGDHILFDITPNISYWPGEDNPLKEYLSSLEKVYPLDVDLALPGHRGIQNNHRKRIKELQQHHEARIKEILSALKDGDKTCFEIAPYVKWDIVADSWEMFPTPQKWFALGETIAHARYLESKGIVHKKTRGDVFTYSLS
jgi:glyoxylase-like metal-dependent hydrolase (beta-lactamase superfamily II)